METENTQPGIALFFLFFCKSRNVLLKLSHSVPIGSQQRAGAEYVRNKVSTSKDLYLVETELLL
jgi:hypothetical protein